MQILKDTFENDIRTNIERKQYAREILERTFKDEYVWRCINVRIS